MITKEQWEAKHGKWSPTLRTTQSGRIRSRAEIQTPPWVVESMVDNLEPIKLDKTYLEICCWDAPFLVEILKRKLKLCCSYDDILTAYKTCYGYEYESDNLQEGRERLKSFFPKDKNISMIVNTNVVQMDGLTGLNPETDEEVFMFDWKENEWFSVKEMMENG